MICHLWNVLSSNCANLKLWTWSSWPLFPLYGPSTPSPIIYRAARQEKPLWTKLQKHQAPQSSSSPAKWAFRTNNPDPLAPLPPPLSAWLLSHSLIKETMKHTHRDILVRTEISSNKLLPHLVTFMGQGNHMSHAAGSRSAPANWMLLCLTLITLKGCGVPNSEVFHHPYFPNACTSLSGSKLCSFLPLLFSLLGLLTPVLGLCYLVFPPPASFWDRLGEEHPFGI